MKNKNIKGFSLLEILVSVLIISVLISASIPSFTKFLNETKKDKALDMLNASIYSAKNYAINNRVTVYLNVSDNGTSSKWESFKIYTTDKDLLVVDNLDGVLIETLNGIRFNINGQVIDENNQPIIDKIFCIHNNKENSSKYLLHINYLGKTKVEEKDDC